MDSYVILHHHLDVEIMMSPFGHLDAEIVQRFFFSHIRAKLIVSPHKNNNTHTHIHILPVPVLRTRSRRSGVLGVGLRVCRGERVLGVEAGELGSGGSSGGG